MEITKMEVRGVKLKRLVAYNRRDGERKMRSNKVARVIRTEERVAAVAKLAMEGKTQPEIAKELGVGVVSVIEMLKEARRNWLESSLVAYDELKAGELAKINEIERRQWEEITELDAMEEKKR